MDNEPTKSGAGGAREGAGRPQKYTRLDVWKELNDRKFDLIQELVNIASAPDTDRKLKVQIFLELLQYIAAKQRSITHEIDNTNDSMKEILALVAMEGRPEPSPKKQLPKRPRKSKKDDPPA